MSRFLIKFLGHSALIYFILTIGGVGDEIALFLIIITILYFTGAIG